MLPMDFREITAKLSGKDACYQELLKTCKQLEPDYNRIMDSLSKDDRDAMMQYISASEEMEYRRAQLAATHYAVNGCKIFVKE